MKTEIHQQLCKTSDGCWHLLNKQCFGTQKNSIFVPDEKYNYWLLEFNMKDNKLINEFERHDRYLPGLELPLMDFKYPRCKWKEKKGK